MSDISIAAGPESLTRAEPVRRASSDDRSVSSAAAFAAGAVAAEDTVEISERARLLSRLRELPAVRADLVQQARANTAAGQYDGAEIPDAIIDRLVEDVRLFG